MAPVDPPVAALPVAHLYLDRFVKHVHALVAEGYSRLNPATLADEPEEHISAQIVWHAERWLDEPNAPPWVASYFISAEPPVEGVMGEKGVRKGKARPRIDIRVVSSEASPRPVFTFEAKRFYARSSAKEYLGGEGLRTLLDGTKGRHDLAAGMLGYVQAGAPADVARAVLAMLEKDRAAHGLNETGEIWTEAKHDSRIPLTLTSQHRRGDSLPPLAVYHSFLPCCAAALPTGASTP